MKILKLAVLFLLIGLAPVWAAKRAEVKQLTIGGVAVNAYAIGSGATVTSDSVYQNGNLGFLSLATQVVGNVSINYQVSYDNLIWWTPNTASSGTLTPAGTIANSITSNSWIISTAVLAPYMRFIYQSTGSSTITADALWQDESQ